MATMDRLRQNWMRLKLKLCQKRINKRQSQEEGARVVEADRGKANLGGLVKVVVVVEAGMKEVEGQQLQLVWLN